jgi:H+/Cl- antiporter ClcA
MERVRGAWSVWMGSSLILPVALVGIVGGLIGAAYLRVLRLVTDWIGPSGHSSVAHGVILVSVGVLVAGLVHWLGDGGGVDLLVDNIHVLGGADDVRRLRSLVPVSLACIGSGGTLGPEAPLVQTSGSIGTWFAQRLDLEVVDTRILTITGMAAGFAVLFGAPIGAALFALEILHRRGLQYYEALVPALVGALAGYAVNLVVTGLGLKPIWHLPASASPSGVHLLVGAGCGVLGAAGAWLFAIAVAAARRVTRRVPVTILPIVGGLALAALAWWSPFALTNGEAQVSRVVAGGLTAGALAVAIGAKFAGVLVTLTGRWSGGFIIPLFFIGIAGGQLIHLLVPSLDATVMAAALAVALCVGVTKTPLGSTLVVTQMAGLTLLPATLVAAVVALLLTNRTVVIESQRARTPAGHQP